MRPGAVGINVVGDTVVADLALQRRRAAVQVAEAVGAQVVEELLPFRRNGRRGCFSPGLCAAGRRLALACSLCEGPQRRKRRVTGRWLRRPCHCGCEHPVHFIEMPGFHRHGQGTGKCCRCFTGVGVKEGACCWVHGGVRAGRFRHKNVFKDPGNLQADD